MADQDNNDKYAYGAARWRPRPGTAPTPRNLEVFAATMLLGRDEAASALGLHPNTVRVHVSELFTRLRVTHRWEAAYELGWLQIPSEYLSSPQVCGIGQRSEGQPDTGPTGWRRAPK